MSKPWENKPWEANSSSWKNPEYKKNNDAWKNPPYKAMNATWQKKSISEPTQEIENNMVPGLYVQFNDNDIGKLLMLVFSYAGFNLELKKTALSDIYLIDPFTIKESNSETQSEVLRNLLVNAILSRSVESGEPMDSIFFLRFRNDNSSSVFALFDNGISEKVCAQIYNTVKEISHDQSYKIPELVLVCWIAHEIAEQMYYCERSGQSMVSVFSTKEFQFPIYEAAHTKAIKVTNNIFKQLSGHPHANLEEVKEEGTIYTKIDKYSKDEILKKSPSELKEMNFVARDLNLEDEPKYWVRSLEQPFSLSDTLVQRLVYSWWWVRNAQSTQMGQSNYNLTSYNKEMYIKYRGLNLV